MIRKDDALEYHELGRKGKIEVISSKPLLTQRHLSLAYSPGVADPCLEIHENPSDAYRYTAKGNLVAVISNGTAVLGLGNIGALAGKPVMEGKGCLFKKFADIDVFDIEVDTEDVEEFIAVVSKLEPTFGGINLEDIKAPECFEIEERLKKMMDIPVFHDDQHGTAIISGAALLNAIEFTGKKIEDLKVVVSGAGASAIACAKFYISLGCKKENFLLADSKGVVFKGRAKGMNKHKEYFAVETERRTLADAMVGADVFLGCSVAGLVTQDMVRSMADKPIVFALANPDPEISYPDAKAARDDVIMATGRSDYPNQVNNVLGFPFIFRGALDVHASEINEAMKVAAAKALAALAKEEVPESVARAYEGANLTFGPDYIIPKPFDPRVLTWEAPAVAKAAMDTGVARKRINLDEYQVELERIYGRTHVVMRQYSERAKEEPKRVVFPEGDEERILRAARILVDRGIARPVLLGEERVIRDKIKMMNMDMDPKAIEIVNPYNFDRTDEYCKEFSTMRARRGVTMREARYRMHSRKWMGMMMVHMGDADLAVTGLTTHYPVSIRPVLEVIGTRKGAGLVAGMYMILLKQDVKFFADCTVKVNPNAEEVAEIAMVTADKVREMGVEPRIAMISYSNFGSSRGESSVKMAKATQLVKDRRPDLEVEGEMQFDTAADYDLMKATYPFTELKGPANTFIFPNLDAGNMSYKMMATLGGAEVVGPILVGLRKPVEVIQRGDSVEAIVRLVSIATVESMGGMATVSR